MKVAETWPIRSALRMKPSGPASASASESMPVDWTSTSNKKSGTSPLSLSAPVPGGGAPSKMPSAQLYSPRRHSRR
eukprot:580737-Alexandrium_andersonii.AAC.1